MTSVGPSQYQRWRRDVESWLSNVLPRVGYDQVVDLTVALSHPTVLPITEPHQIDNVSRVWGLRSWPSRCAAGIMQIGRNPRYSLQSVWLLTALLTFITEFSLDHTKVKFENSATLSYKPTDNHILSRSVLASIIISIPIVIDTVPALFVQSVDESIERDFVRLFALATITFPNVLLYSSALSPDTMDLKQFFQFILLFELAIYYMYQLAATRKLPVYCSFFDITVDIQLICLLAFVYNLASHNTISGSHLIWFVVFSIGKRGSSCLSRTLSLYIYIHLLIIVL
jgi:hypothetical protein